LLQKSFLPHIGTFLAGVNRVFDSANEVDKSPLVDPKPFCSNLLEHFQSKRGWRPSARAVGDGGL
jgi:hypothetical protein